MKSSIEGILNKRNPKNTEEAKQMLREIIQNIVLAGLSKSHFFDIASFYGGTALRIFYGLDRYSEDLGFTLNNKDESFRIDPYLVAVENEAKSFGLSIGTSIKKKTTETPIESAFAKTNTYNALLEFKAKRDLINHLHKGETTKVKLEVDCNPAYGFNKIIKWTDAIEFCPVAVLDEESLFSGKIHALLCRNYKNTVKGRDFYDFVFYTTKNIRPNMTYLRNKLIESRKLDESSTFSTDTLKHMLIERINSVDFEAAKKDARRFVMKNDDLDYFRKEFFLQLISKL